MSLSSNPSVAGHIDVPPNRTSHAKDKSHDEDHAPSPSSTIVVQSVSEAAVRCSANTIFSSLPNDVMARIIHFALAHSQRGVPYYPPIKPPCLVPLSLASRHFRRMLAAQCESDLGYIDDVYAAGRDDEERLAAKKDLVQFYRVQDGHLKKFNLHKKSSLSQLFRLYATEIVLSSKPCLTEIDVSDIPKSDTYFARTLQAVVDVIRHSASSLETLKMGFHNIQFVHMIEALSLPHLKDLNVQLPHSVSTSTLVEFLRKHGARLETLSFSSAGNEVPEEAVGQIVSYAPRIKHLCFNGGMDPALSFSFIALIRAYSQLQSVSVHNYGLYEELRSALESHPGKPKVYVRRSLLSELPRILAEVPSFRRTLVRAETIVCETAGDLMALAQLQNVEELDIRVAAHMVRDGLGTALSRLKRLTSVTIACETVGGAEATRALVDEQLVHALCKGTALRQVVIASPPLCMRSLQKMMSECGERLEYLVAGIRPAGRSHMLCIIEMVKWAMRHNDNLRVLCFGLGLCHDGTASEWYGELLRTLEEAERRLKRLSTHYLRLNGKALLTFQKAMEEEWGDDVFDIEEEGAGEYDSEELSEADDAGVN
ncbi:unnamed protein product [Agarophyton chilense]|eukprot:gb/GEZJ01004861.1/.p1 GENE.gb/GEZJ01004861.1/~~gb/GEZJ01004861.1/.p1  ORF type:complete len:597 (-),score=81.77 gb/GEZJ01004861.1/:949-2739(-)